MRCTKRVIKFSAGNRYTDHRCYKEARYTIDGGDGLCASHLKEEAKCKKDLPYEIFRLPISEIIRQHPDRIIQIAGDGGN